MGAADPRLEDALVEMSWGAWEGRRLSELREELGDAMAANEARGLDFRPPGGESPREVQARLEPWLREIAGDDDTVNIAVAHKGVIRALYALAAGWDMTGKPPEKLRDGCGHLFEIDENGRVEVTRLNVPLAPEGAP